jgi:hypothetical protein
MTRSNVHSQIGPMFEGLDLGVGFLGGSWQKGNCGALGWKEFSSLREQGFDVLGFSIVGPWDDTCQWTWAVNKESLIQYL